MPMDDDTQPALLQRRNLASLVLVNMGVGTHAIVWFMVVTAMPSVVDDLRAAPYLSWATSIYLVSTILGGASMALLKARLGARPALVLAGIVVMAGGLLAAAAPGIALVLVGRVLQGLGEGVLVALSYALVRELFDIRLLPRVFGIQAVTWAFAIFSDRWPEDGSPRPCPGAPPSSARRCCRCRCWCWCAGSCPVRRCARATPSPSPRCGSCCWPRA